MIMSDLSMTGGHETKDEYRSADDALRWGLATMPRVGSRTLRVALRLNLWVLRIAQRLDKSIDMAGTMAEMSLGVHANRLRRLHGNGLVCETCTFRTIHRFVHTFLGNAGSSVHVETFGDAIDGAECEDGAPRRTVH